MWSEFPEGKQKREATEKVLEDIVAENLPKFCRKHIPINSNNWANPKQNEPKEIHTTIHHNQTSENKDKQKYRKQSEKNDTLPIWRKTIWIGRYLIRNHRGQKTVAHFERKELLSRIPHPAKISLRNEGEIKTFSDKRKLMEFVTSRPTLKEWLKKVL